MIISFGNNSCDIINDEFFEFYSLMISKCILLPNYFKLKMNVSSGIQDEILKTTHLKIDLVIVNKNVRPNLHAIEEHVL